jgi:DNA repair protein RadC
LDGIEVAHMIRKGQFATKDQSADATLSRTDIESTKEIIAAAKPLDIEVRDHLIVGRDGCLSFQEAELI